MAKRSGARMLPGMPTRRFAAPHLQARPRRTACLHGALLVLFSLSFYLPLEEHTLEASCCGSQSLTMSRSGPDSKIALLVRRVCQIRLDHLSAASRRSPRSSSLVRSRWRPRGLPMALTAHVDRYSVIGRSPPYGLELAVVHLFLFVHEDDLDKTCQLIYSTLFPRCSFSSPVTHQHLLHHHQS